MSKNKEKETKIRWNSRREEKAITWKLRLGTSKREREAGRNETKYDLINLFIFTVGVKPKYITLFFYLLLTIIIIEQGAMKKIKGTQNKMS